MANKEEIFNASQFMIIKCIKNLTNLSDSFEEFNPILAKITLNFIDEDMKTLLRLIQVMESIENEEVEDVELEEVSDISSSDESSTSSDESSTFCSSTQ